MLEALGRLGIPVLLALTASTAMSREPVARITGEIDNADRVAISGTGPPMALAADEAGRVPSGIMLRGVSLVFGRSAAQQADLRALIAAQQDPASSNYHKWLTPDEFAARFGAANADIATMEWWLTQQGLSVDGVSRSKDRITFSGTVGKVESALDTELHYYKVNGETHFAPSRAISVPAALSPVLESVANLSNFRPEPRIKSGKRNSVIHPRFTSSQTGNHFLTPADMATIYDIAPAYNAGYTGTGQSIAVVGQSEVVPADIEHFQRAAGLTVKNPTSVLVPGTGSAVVQAGDEAESDLDIEYSGGIAPGATIYFVYVGSNPSYSVWDSIRFAVDNRLASIVSMSYGVCEAGLTSGEYTSREGVLAQAAAQGQSVIVAAGDEGSTDCAGSNTITTSQQQMLAVDFPASSEYVTGMGGTEFSATDTTASNIVYWQPATGDDVVNSALSYIPERVWNDDSPTYGIGAGGGGVSTLTARPAWQAGVPGIDAGSYRLVPDISLDASGLNAPYLYCSSDASTGISGSCSHGFRDSNNLYLTTSGGTSVGAPIFAGMLAIINERLDSSGQGVVNPILYTLAADSMAYASAFHDITNGGNQCTAGSIYCSPAGTSEYAATVGYDEASGLGSIDFFNLLKAWPAPSGSLALSDTALTAMTTMPGPGVSDAITITVTSDSGSSTATPTGTLTIVVDGTTETSSLPLSNGSATYDFSSASTGSHVITAHYSGDMNYTPSSATLSVQVETPTFTVAATDVTVQAGDTATSTITVTPKAGYTGTVSWQVTSSPPIANGCLSLPDTVVADAGAVTTTLTVHTSAAACGSVAMLGPVNNNRTSDRRGGALLTALVFGLLGLFRNRFVGVSRLITALGFCLALSGCSHHSGSPPVAAKGSYVVTIVGTDTALTSIAASTTVRVTIE